MQICSFIITNNYRGQNDWWEKQHQKCTSSTRAAHLAHYTLNRMACLWTIWSSSMHFNDFFLTCAHTIYSLSVLFFLFVLVFCLFANCKQIYLDDSINQDNLFRDDELWFTGIFTCVQKEQNQTSVYRFFPPSLPFSYICKPKCQWENQPLVSFNKTNWLFRFVFPLKFVFEIPPQSNGNFWNPESYIDRSNSFQLSFTSSSTVFINSKKFRQAKQYLFMIYSA